MTNQISVSRALSKSKSLLDDAINQTAAYTRFSFVEVGNKTTDGKNAKSELDDAKKALQSVNDKINESFRLRQGINQINATTKIDLGFGEMTILDVLAYKLYIIPKKRELFQKLVSDRNLAVAEYKKQKERHDKTLSDLESSKDDVSALLEHAKKQEPKLVCFDDEIEELRKHITFFESEFDAVMSEMNPSLKFDV